ncbi:hypothetical protein D9756_009428 [Leucocoprinus leucothites]|uniref:F-box domain-containing protein n=1 Tax=Leucocoprinus leucothites TaxID=201217 RepID=A0A8H5FUE2_9AGAR|nr:hypothetical protein D9756_009428 [Leucoagaricus leucothites]
MTTRVRRCPLRSLKGTAVNRGGQHYRIPPSSPEIQNMVVPPPLFTEPSTADTLHHARLHLESTRSSILALDAKIASAEMALVQLVREAKASIAKMAEEKSRLEEDEATTKSYLSPVRRLPAELLREIFLWHFEEHEACAWVLAAVCSSWRRLALRTPKLWAKPESVSCLRFHILDFHLLFLAIRTHTNILLQIRLITTPTSSPELIRLWLERSGHSVSLDIEIYLRVVEHPSTPQSSYVNANFIDAQRRRGRRSSGSGGSTGSSWSSFTSHNGIMTHYVYPGAPISPLQAPSAAVASPSIPPAGEHREIITNGAGVGIGVGAANKPNIYWAHIAFYYLVEQMPRWERFVFRYDKAFKSMTALASINGVAPLLKEFEVSSSEGGCTSDWPWLPNVPNPPTTTPRSTTAPFLPSLTSLTLHQVPFRWSSPIFSLSNLKHLNLRAPVSPALPLDRIRFMISNNPHLETLALYFQGVLPNVLPLASLVMREVKELRVGGHWLLSQLLDCLSTPKLRKLSLFVDPRESAEDVIVGLLTRSAAALNGTVNPSAPQYTHLSAGTAGDIHLEELSLGYDTPPGPNFLSSSSHSFIPPATSTLINHPHMHAHVGIHNMYHYYVPSPTGIVPSWRTLLAHMPHLRVLKVGNTPLESLLVCLGGNEDDGSGLGGVVGSGLSGSGNGWPVPKLEVLMMRGWCGPYGYGGGAPFGAGVGGGGAGGSNGAGYGMGGSEVVAKLVAVIESRNPDSGAAGLGGGGGGGWNGTIANWGSGGGSGAVKRLRYLEMHDCELGIDVERWLGVRIESVVLQPAALFLSSGFYFFSSENMIAEYVAQDAQAKKIFLTLSGVVMINDYDMHDAPFLGILMSFCVLLADTSYYSLAKEHLAQ